MYYNFGLAFSLVFIFVAAEENLLSNGFGDTIEWVEWKSARSLSQAKSKPLMVILHKTWCPACKTLKPKVAQSQPFSVLAKNFVMVNAKEDDEAHQVTSLSPDGQYIPRIIFLDQDGEVLSDIYNESGNPDYRFYYFSEESILASMKKVLALTKRKTLSENKHEL